MHRYFYYLLVSWAFLSTTSLYSQPKFDLIPVDQAAASFNTVTSTVHKVGEAYYLYSAGDSDKIDVYQISEDGNIEPVSVQDTYQSRKGIRGLVADTIAGKNFLFAGLKGANAVEVFEINPDGTLSSVFVTPDTDSTYLVRVITLQVIHLASGDYLYAGGLEKPAGLSAYKIAPSGKLTHLQSMADTEEIHTDGIIGMSIHEIEGTTYLYTGGFQDNGLSSFRIYEDGTFENLNNIADDHTLFLNGAYPVISATKKGWRFVVVGHRHHTYYRPTPWVKDRKTYYHHGDAVSVFLVNEKGEVNPRSAFRDNTETLIQGQTRLQKLPLDDDYDLIAVATRDDQSLQLFALNETGRLIEAGNVKTGFPIYYGLSGQKIGDKLFLFAGAVSDSTIVSYRL
ncbi:MAG: stress protein, partial [Bacteroidota bacterium]